MYQDNRTVVALDRAWYAVTQKFNDKTDSDILHSSDSSTRDVLASIQSKAIEPAITTKLEYFVQNTLVYIQRCEDTVSSETGYNLERSKECCSAVNFVIVKMPNSRTFLQDFTQLLEQLSTSFGSLASYLEFHRTNIPLSEGNILQTFYAVLERFMDIMTLTFDVGCSPRRWASEADSLARTIENTGALELMKLHVSEIIEDLISAPSVAQFGVPGARPTEPGRDVEYDRSNRPLEIPSTASMSAYLLRSPLELDIGNSTQARYTEIARERVKDTGQWLMSPIGNFARWRDFGNDAPSVLLITGDAGCGKSFLASAVIDHLWEWTRTSTNNTKCFAVHDYISQLPDKRRPELSCIKAIYCVAWQLAHVDDTFREFFAESSLGHPRIDTSIQAWKRFIGDYEPTVETTFFIVMDGVDGEFATSLASLLASAKDGQQTQRSKPRLRVRVCLTSRSDVKRCSARAKEMFQISLNSVDYEEDLVANIDDVRNVASRRLAHVPFFCNGLSLQKGYQKQLVLNKLCRQVQNDFFQLDLTLSELEHCENQQQLDKTLSRINEHTSSKIRRQIRRLNHALSADEIEVLNVVLMYVESFSSLNHPLNIKTIEQYVRLSLDAPSSFSLKTQVATRYQDFFKFNTDNTIAWRHQETRVSLIQSFENDQTIGDSQLKPAARSDGFDEEELDLVEKTVLASLSDLSTPHQRSLADKYGFAEFFASKRHEEKVAIKLSVDQGHVQSLYIALKVLCERFEPEDVDMIRKLAMESLNGIIKRANISAASVEQVKLIRYWLTILLWRDDMIDKWGTDLAWRYRMFSCSRSLSAEIKAWICAGQESDAPYTRRETYWRDQAINKDINQPEEIWNYSMAFLTDRWLRFGGGGADGILSFIAAKTVEQRQSWLFRHCTEPQIKLIEDHLDKRRESEEETLKEALSFDSDSESSFVRKAKARMAEVDAELARKAAVDTHPASSTTKETPTSPTGPTVSEPTRRETRRHFELTGSTPKLEVRLVPKEDRSVRRERRREARFRG